MAQEEEVLGKAYDSRLMKRLIQYLRPYKWQTGIALGSILLKVGADVLGPTSPKLSLIATCRQFLADTRCWTDS